MKPPRSRQKVIVVEVEKMPTPPPVVKEVNGLPVFSIGALNPPDYDSDEEDEQE